MAKFEDLRAHLSHFVLRNGILARLGITSEAYEAGNSARMELIVNSILEIKEVSDNHREAVKAWQGASGYEPGVRRGVAELLSFSRRFRTRRPSSLFPADDVVESWLTRMEVLLFQLNGFPELAEEERRRIALEFATGALNVLDFVRDLDIDSPGFRKYFESTQRHY